MFLIFGGCFISDFVLYNIISIFFLVFLMVFCVYVFFGFFGAFICFFWGCLFLSCFFNIYFVIFFILSNLFRLFGCLFLEF